MSKDYPYGKQCAKRGGMWYMPVSGIWQSVWLESVPDKFVKGFKVTPDAPYLYEIIIEAGEDVVTGYFALRTIRVGSVDGKPGILLNDKPCFLHAVLDQGYFSDGIYLPKDLKGYAADILAMKNLGFNALRKHIKIEPEYFYYACDKLGMLVMQDMVNNGSYQFIRDTALPTLGMQTKKDNASLVSKRRKDIFINHTIDTIKQLYNHPCIVYYTIFNEGWGQFEADRLYDIVNKHDQTRITDTTSGWFRREKSDVEDESNGFYTYDRKVLKVNRERMLEVVAKLK